MTTWAVVGQTGGSVGSGALTLSFGSTPAAGDLLIAFMSVRGGETPTLDAEWNGPISSPTTSNADAASSTGIGQGFLWWCKRGGADPDLTVTRGSGANVICWATLVVETDAADFDLDQSSSNTAGSSSTSVTSPGFTTGADDAFLVACTAAGRSAQFGTYDAVTDPSTASAAFNGTTETFTTAITAGTWYVRSKVTTTLGADTGRGVGVAVKATAGATGEFSCSTNSAAFHAMCVASFIEVATGFTITADAGAFTVAGTDANLEYGRLVAADAGAVAITGTDATLSWGRKVAADAGAFTVTGTDASLLYGREVAADAGSVAITGTDANLEFGRLVAADAGAFTIAGTDASLEFGGEVAADAGAFTIAGTDANLEYGRLFAADAGAVTITGADATLIYGTAGAFTIGADPGAFTITGADASLELGAEVAADPGAVSITGTDANLEFGRLVAANDGAVTITGTDASLEFGRTVIADAGSVTITGTDATLTFDPADGVLTADPGAVVITGVNATLTWSGETTGRVRDGDGGGGERSRRRRRTGYRVHKWQLEDAPLEDVAEGIAAEVVDVPPSAAVEYIEANADILALLGVPAAPMVAKIEAAPRSMMPAVATLEMERIRAAIEEFLDEEETIAMLLSA